MNWERFKKNIGWRFELEPIACRLDELGNKLPPVSDDWLLQAISPDGVVHLSNIRTGHVAELGKDHIYDFRSNPSRSQTGINHGFLVLKMQIFMSGNRLWLRPNSRPGERVNPHHSPSSRLNPPETILRLLGEVVAQGWHGTPASFNALSAQKLYGKEFADLLPELPDYFSSALISGYIMITSITDHGNHSDGTPDTIVSVALTAEGRATLASWQSNQAPQRGTSFPLGRS